MSSSTGCKANEETSGTGNGDDVGDEGCITPGSLLTSDGSGGGGGEGGGEGSDAAIDCSSSANMTNAIARLSLSRTSFSNMCHGVS